MSEFSNIKGLIQTAKYSSEGKYGVVQSYLLFRKCIKMSKELGVTEDYLNKNLQDLFTHLSDIKMKKLINNKEKMIKYLKENKAL